MKTTTAFPRLAVLGLAAGLLLHPSSFILAQGGLTPPGAPAPLFKTLQQIEPRTPISFLPTNLTVAGSFYLTTSLTGATGITISASGVTLDLRGFSLVGGTGAGIGVSGARTNLSIGNGTVRGWNGNGVGALLAVNSVFHNLRVVDNNDNGLVVGANNLVSDCLAMNNIVGINVGFGTTVRGCVLNTNLSDGIQTAAGCTVSGCTASANNGSGIMTADGSTVIGCTAWRNIGADGIQVGSGCTVRDCTATTNSSDGIRAGAGSLISGCTVRANQFNGIETGAGCLIKDCTATFQVATGIVSGDASAVSGCVAYRNGFDGLSVASFSQALNNLCVSNGTTVAHAGLRAVGDGNRIDSNHLVRGGAGYAYSGAGTNLFIRNSADLSAQLSSGTILGPGVAYGVGNGTDVSGYITNNSPWANFYYGR